MWSVHEKTIDYSHDEGVEYKEEVIAEVISKYAPDWRRCLNDVKGMRLVVQ